MSEVETWHGLMIPDLRVTASATSEYGPHVGPATPGDNTGTMVVRSLRSERDAVVDDVVLTASRAGSAATAGRPAALTATVGTGDEMGWMYPASPWQFRYTGSVSLGAQRVTRRGLSWSSWIATGDLSEYNSSDAHDVCPGSEPGTVLHVVVDTVSLGAIITSHLYADGAVTAPESTAQIATEIGSDTILRARVAARSDGTALLIVAVRAASGATRDRVHQWASDDAGRSWSYIGRSDDGSTDHPTTIGAIVATRTGYAVVTAANDGTHGGDEVLVRRIPSPRIPVWSASSSVVTFAADVWDDGTSSQAKELQAAADVDENGRIWLIAVTNGGARLGYVQYSDDDGATWENDDTTNALYGYWYSADSASDRPGDLSAAAVQGSVVAGYEYGTGHYEVRAGGWSSRVMPPLTTGGVLMGRATGCTSMYLATNDAPADYGWTASGTSTATASAGQLAITGTGGTRAVRAYNITTAGSSGEKVAAVRWTAKTAHNVTTHQSPIYVDVAVSDGAAHGYSVRIAIGHDEVRLYGRTGTITYSQLDSASVTNLDGDWVDWIARVSIDSTTGAYLVHVSGRRHGASVTMASYLDNWHTKINKSGTLTDIYADEPSDRIGWGSWVNNTETAYWLHISHREAGSLLAATTDIEGHPAAPRMWVPPDVLAEVTDGTAAEGDTWTIATEADGAASNALDADVGVAWEATGTGAETLTLSWPSGQAAQMFGVLLRGVVAENLTISGDGILNLNAVYQLGPLNATKDGTIITPRTTASVMVREGEGTTNPTRLLVSDGTDKGVGKIIQSRAGHWSNTTYASRLVLDQMAAAVGDGNVTATFLPGDVLLIVHKSTDNYTSVEIDFTAATATWPAGTRWRVQRAMVGPILVMGSGWSWSTSMRTDVTTDDGRTSDGRRHPRALRPAYRTLAINWQEGVDESQAPESGSGTLYGDGTDDTAFKGTTLHTIEGVLCELGGEAGEVVAIFDVPRTGTGAVAEDGSLTLNRRHQFLHGRMTSSFARDGVISASIGDLARGGEVTIEEIT